MLHKILKDLPEREFSCPHLASWVIRGRCRATVCQAWIRSGEHRSTLKLSDDKSMQIATVGKGCSDFAHIFFQFLKMIKMTNSPMPVRALFLTTASSTLMKYINASNTLSRIDTWNFQQVQCNGVFIVHYRQSWFTNYMQKSPKENDKMRDDEWK